jgi:hypothetical protein
MKKSLLALAAVALMTAFAACSHYETYAEQKEKENDAIKAYISKNAISVISEEVFRNQDYTTDVERNEYVLINSSGVYMQIVRKGCGKPLEKGETATVLCRFTERNLFTDAVTFSNNNQESIVFVDKMSVTRTSDSYSASFIANQSLMYAAYGASVPAGWLAPFYYINVGRPEKETDEIAKVKVIIPSAQGTQSATTNVIPYLYEITYERGI